MRGGEVAMRGDLRRATVTVRHRKGEQRRGGGKKRATAAGTVEGRRRGECGGVKGLEDKGVPSETAEVTQKGAQGVIALGKLLGAGL